MQNGLVNKLKELEEMPKHKYRLILSLSCQDKDNKDLEIVMPTVSFLFSRKAKKSNKKKLKKKKKRK